MSKKRFVKPRKEWTAEEKELNRLSWLASSNRQMDRITARVDLALMEQKHGRDQMDKWWANIQEVKHD